MTVRNDPTYACVHRLARRFLAASLSLETVGERLPAPVRPSFDLYELWTFLALKQQLEAAYPSAQWRWSPSPAPDLYGGFGAKSRFTGVIPGRGTLELTFNLTFSGWLATQHRPSATRWSISGERRPDLVLTWKGEHHSSGWVCFNAKYRVRSQAQADAFSSLHLYRDSLHWVPFGGRAGEDCHSSPHKMKPAPPLVRAGFSRPVWRRNYDDGPRCTAAYLVLLLAGANAGDAGAGG